MKLLADEHIYRNVVQWLRSIGHDVAWIAEDSPAVDDDSILERANREDRIVLSMDLGFGESIVRRQMKAPGLLLLRMGTLTGREVERSIRKHWPEIENELRGNLVILTPRQARLRPIRD
jgi:predicted nuclease of predicted toxin-antitoxin system